MIGCQSFIVSAHNALLLKRRFLKHCLTAMLLMGVLYPQLAGAHYLSEQKRAEYGDEDAGCDPKHGKSCTLSLYDPNGPVENPYRHLPSTFRTSPNNPYGDASGLYEQSVADPRLVKGIDTFMDPSIIMRARTCIGVPMWGSMSDPDAAWCMGYAYEESATLSAVSGECRTLATIRFCGRVAQPGQYGNRTDKEVDYRVQGNPYVNRSCSFPDEEEGGSASGTASAKEGEGVCENGILKTSLTTNDGTKILVYGKVCERRSGGNGDATKDCETGGKLLVYRDKKLKAIDQNDYNKEKDNKVLYGLVKAYNASSPPGDFATKGNIPDDDYPIGDSGTVSVRDGYVITPRVQVCAYEDPKDGADSAIDSSNLDGYMPYQYHAPSPDNTSSVAGEWAKILGTMGGAGLAVSVIVGISSSILLLPAAAMVLGAAIAALVALGTATVNHVVYQDEGCIDPGIGPYPPAFCDFIESGRPTPFAQAICAQGESSANGHCVPAKDGKYNTFEEPMIRVGFGKLINVCQADQTSTVESPCVILPAELSNKEYGYPPLVQECTQGQQSQSSNLCIQPYTGTYTSGKQYSISYRTDPSTGAISAQGIDEGSYADLIFRYYPMPQGSVVTILDTQTDPKKRKFEATMDEPTEICVEEITDSEEGVMVGCVQRLPMPKPVVEAYEECKEGGVPGQNCGSNTKPLMKAYLSSPPPKGQEKQIITLGVEESNKCAMLYGIEVCSSVLGENVQSDQNGNYLTGGTDLCLNGYITKEMVLTRMVNQQSPDGYTIEYPSTDPKDLLVPSPPEEVTSDWYLPEDESYIPTKLPQPNGQFTLSYTEIPKIVYDINGVKHVPVAGESADSAVTINTTNECTTSQGKTVCVKEASRTKTPKELNLCVPIPGSGGCPIITEATAESGYATWPEGTPDGKVKGVCKQYYGIMAGDGQPVRRCEKTPDGTVQWGPIDHECIPVCAETTVTVPISVSASAIPLTYNATCKLPKLPSGATIRCKDDGHISVGGTMCYLVEWDLTYECMKSKTNPAELIWTMTNRSTDSENASIFKCAD